MKVLLVGGMTGFVSYAVVDKLLKERCELFHIAGAKNAKQERSNSKIVTYHADLDDEYIQQIVRSISPDAVIFMGAFDERYRWSDYHRCSSRYMSELTNILVTAADNGVKKFIYLSSVNVYGFDCSGNVSEDTPANPGNMKSVIISQGEKICENLSGRINTVSLRFGAIYGSTRLTGIDEDYVAKKCYDALNEKKIVINNQVRPIISVNDAVIAVWKAVSLDAESGVYNVCDNETISDRELCETILEQYGDEGIEVAEDDRFKPQDYKIDGSKFNAQYSFFQKINYKEGIKATAKFVRDNFNRYKLGKGDDTVQEENIWFYLKALGKKALPFAESLLLFAVFALCRLFLSENNMLGQIDVLMLYVAIVSVTFGKQQAVVSVLLCIGFGAFEAVRHGDEPMTLFVNYEFLASCMFYFIIGMLVGHSRDMLRRRINSDEDRIEYLEDEYKKLNEINDITVTVKQAIEDRLLSQGDSLSKVYDVVKDIDSILPRQIYMASTGVLAEMLNSKHICVYAKAFGDDEFRLEHYTTPYAAHLGDRITSDDFADAAAYLNKGMVFNNKELKKGCPMLAAPVTGRGGVKAVIMVWDLEFEGLTYYHVNLFATLTKIIGKALERAYNYRANINETDRVKLFALNDYDPDIRRGSVMLVTSAEFDALSEGAGEAREKYGIPYETLTFDLGARQDDTDLSREKLSEVLEDYGREVYAAVAGNMCRILLFNRGNAAGETSAKAA